jgi:Icc-related predicted phosphoesterase
LPRFVTPTQRRLYPVLGSSRIDQQIRQLGAKLHVYGHSHVNRRVNKDGVTYINNAYGYPHETMISSKSLLCVYEYDANTQRR